MASCSHGVRVLPFDKNHLGLPPREASTFVGAEIGHCRSWSAELSLHRRRSQDYRPVLALQRWFLVHQSGSFVSVSENIGPTRKQLAVAI